MRDLLDTVHGFVHSIQESILLLAEIRHRQSDNVDVQIYRGAHDGAGEFLKVGCIVRAAAEKAHAQWRSRYAYHEGSIPSTNSIKLPPLKACPLIPKLREHAMSLSVSPIKKLASRRISHLSARR